MWHAGPWVSELLAVEVAALVHSETPGDSATPHPLMMGSHRSTQYFPVLTRTVPFIICNTSLVASALFDTRSAT